MDQNSYRALRQHAAWIDLSGRGKIRATGDDRVRLLHAMCTNHVENLQPGTGCYAFFLTAQGRIVADVNLFYLPDYLLLDTEPDARQRVMEHLDKFIIADDVTLHDFTEATSTINLEGPSAEAILDELGGSPARIPCSIVEWGHGHISHWTYTGGPGYSLFVPADEKQSVIEKLSSKGVPHADLETADVVRLEYGRPRYGVDFTDANIPQETQQMQAVHFNKGCYLGQEIVERVRSRGHVNRVLVSLDIDTRTPPPPGTKIESGGKDAGEITSSGFSPDAGKAIAFAVIRAETMESPLSVGGAPATVAIRRAPTAV